jgi:hypothetical protein
MNHATDVSGIQSVVTNALTGGWTLTNPGGVAAVACSCLDPNTGAVTSLTICSSTDFDTCSQAAGSSSASQRRWPIAPWTRCLRRQSRNCRPLILRGFSRRTRPLLGEAGTATIEFALVAIPSAIAGTGVASWLRPDRQIGLRVQSAKPPRSITLPWSNTRISSASRTVDRRCAMMNVVRPATGSSAPARSAPHPSRFAQDQNRRTLQQ